MSRRQIIEIPTEGYDGREINNDDRAEMAGIFLEGFRRAFYWHESTEPMETVIADFLGNLMHYVDRLTIADAFACVDGPPEGTDPLDPGWKPNWDVILDRAYSYYFEEVDKEKAAREETGT